MLAVSAQDQAAEKFRSGARSLQEHDYTAAIRELGQSLRLNPRQPAANRMLGLSYLMLGQYEAALAPFTEAARLDPQDAECWFFVGAAYYHLNFYAKAQQPLETALRLNAKDFRFHEYMGMVLEALGQPARASAELAEAVRLNERREHPAAEPHLDYAMLLYKQDRLVESEVQLRAAISRNPATWRPHFELGKILNRRGRQAEAITEINTALAAADLPAADTARVNRLLGQICLQAGREEEGLRALARAEQVQP